MNKSRIAAGGLSLASAALIAHLTLWEGTRYDVYLDVAGVPTVCQGVTGPDVRMGDRWTPEQCNARLRIEATEHARGVLNCAKVALNQNQFDALAAFAFNVGVAAACDSRAMRLINAGRYAEGCNALAYHADGRPAWSYAGGKFYRGLHARRLAERELCLKPVAPAETAAA